MATKAKQTNQKYQNRTLLSGPIYNKLASTYTKIDK